MSPIRVYITGYNSTASNYESYQNSVSSIDPDVRGLITFKRFTNLVKLVCAGVFGHKVHRNINLRSSTNPFLERKDVKFFLSSRLGKISRRCFPHQELLLGRKTCNDPQLT